MGVDNFVDATFVVIVVVVDVAGSFDGDDGG